MLDTGVWAHGGVQAELPAGGRPGDEGSARGSIWAHRHSSKGSPATVAGYWALLWLQGALPMHLGPLTYVWGRESLPITSFSAYIT